MGRSKKSFDRILSQYKHKDFVFRSTRIPVLNRLGELVIPLKDVTLTYVPVYENIDLPEGTVTPISIIEYFIRQASDHLLLSRCPCRSENGCKDFPTDFACIFMGPAVREVDPEVGRLVSMEEALDHLHEATEMGLVSCVGKFKGDAIMMGIKDHHKLMTVCHCCPCCCISTSFHLAGKRVQSVLKRLEGVTVEIDEEACNGCGLCVRNCIFKQVEIVDKKAVISGECKACGRCAMVCKQQAVKVSVDNPEYIQACIDRIGSYVDITDGRPMAPFEAVGGE